jgi:sugar (pentulose or hexulose) kinase
MISLGIDVGTTHTKVLALDTDSGATLALASASTPIRRDADGDSRRAGDVLAVVVELLARVLAEVEEPDAVASLCVASVGEEVVLLDAAGEAIGETIAWYDPRGSVEAEAFSAGPGGETALYRRWPPDSTFSMFKLMWARDHRPGEYARAVTWTDLGDYVLAGLGGQVVMDWSHASRAGAFDLVECAWDRASIKAAGLNVPFPRLVPSAAVIGTVSGDIARRTGLRQNVSIVAGGHDHLCAAFGAGVRSTDELFLSAGTSEAHLALMASPLEGDVSDGIDQGRFVDADSYYAHINIHSGLFFQQWRRLLYGDTDDDAMYAEIGAVPLGAAGVAFEVADDLRHGRLEGVPYDAGRDVLMRAILEGLARRSAEIIGRLERASGNRFELVLVAGHPTRIPIWRELRMAAYGRPMAAVDEPESAAFGAAVIAARAVVDAEHLVARRATWSD